MASDSEDAELIEFKPGGTLEISLTTWNLEGTCGPAQGSDLLRPGTHHVYVVGTEECERGIAASYMNSSKSKWEEKLTEALGSDYCLIASETLMAIHIIMFARQDVAKHVSQVSTDHVATGLLNGTVGNKGGVCISCLIGDTSVLFVNAHFAAHQDNVEDRNNDFRKICFGTTLRPPKGTGLPLGSPTSEASPTMPTAPATTDQPAPVPRITPPHSPLDAKGSMDITLCYDAVFWMGDLNYRINGLRNMVDVLLKDQAYRDVLLANDQLQLERRKGNVFQGFSEGDILFNPTYKYHKEDGRATDEYDKSAKGRIPAWTDRILYKTNPPFEAGHVKLKKYSSRDEESLRVSDHRPVMAWISLKTQAAGAGFPAASPLQANPSETASRACVVS